MVVLVNAVALAIIVIGTIEVLPPERSRYRPPLEDWSRTSLRHDSEEPNKSLFAAVHESADGPFLP